MANTKIGSLILNNTKIAMYNNRVTLVGMVIVLTLYLTNMIINGFAPFGDGVIISGDNVAQLPGYTEELRRKLFGHESLCYTWKVTGGGSFYYVLSYVLSSVFTLPLIMAPIEYFVVTLNVCFVINSTLMFLAMRVFLLNRETTFKFDKDEWIGLIFPLAYAIMPAVFNIEVFYPYMGCFVIAPITLLGLERFAAGKGWITYVISLSWLVFTNFYIGLMSCIFIVLYYFTLDFSGLKHFVKTSLRILILSILSVGVSAVIILPVLVSISNGGYGMSEHNGVGVYTNWFYYVLQSMWGRKSILVGTSNEAYWECNTYIGLLIPLLCLFYFLEKKIKLETRIRKIVILLVLLLTLNGKTSNYVMHLFHYTVGIPNRHTILVMLFLLVIAEEALYILLNNKMTKLRIMKFMISVAVMTCMYLEVIKTYGILDKVVTFGFVCIVMTLIYCVLIVLLLRKKKAYLLKCILTILVILELSSNYIMNCYKIYDDVDKYYLDKYDGMKDLCDELEDGLYYVGYNGKDTPSDLGMIYGFNNIGGYSTITNFQYMSALNQLGVNASTSIREWGFNSFLDSVFAREYLIQPTSDRYVSYDNDSVGMTYKKVDSKGDMDLYQNDYTLNPIISCESDITPFVELVSKSDVTVGVDDANDVLCETLSGVKGLITTVSADSIVIDNVDNCKAEVVDDRIVFSLNKYNGEYDPSKDAVVHFSFIAPKSGEYIVGTASNQNVGYHNKGETVRSYARIGATTVDPNLGKYACSVKLNVLDTEKYFQAYDVMKNNQMNVKFFNSDRIEGTINADKDTTVFTTIPYDYSWKVTVDGKIIDTQSIGGAFLSFDIEKGKHDVVMSYFPRGLFVGAMISVLSIIVFFILVCIEMKSKNNYDQGEG